MQKALLNVAMIAIVAGSANAAVVYSRTAPNVPSSAFNPGPWLGSADDGLPASTQQMITWDDVGVDPAVMGSNTVLEVTRITFGIRRAAGAPASSLNVYATQWNPAALSLDELLGAAVPPATDFLAGTINMPARVGTGFLTEEFSLGNGVTPLFNVGLIYGLYSNTNVGGFSIGLQFGGTFAQTGARWVIPTAAGQTVGTAADSFWLTDPQQVGVAAADLGAFGGFGLGANNNSFYMIVEGNAIPPPGALAIAGLGGLLAARRRR